LVPAKNITAHINKRATGIGIFAIDSINSIVGNVKISIVRTAKSCDSGIITFFYEQTLLLFAKSFAF
jgi:hypothetical protein